MQTGHPPKPPADTGATLLNIKDYSEKILEMKTELQQTGLTIDADREFIPNMHLSVGELPDKLKGEEILKKFRQDYDCLNYISTSAEYEIKLLKGKNNLTQNRVKAEKDLQNYKDSMKDAFLKQVDAYIDLYVDKIIK